MGKYLKAHLKYRDTEASETSANDREKCALKWQSIKQMRLEMEEKQENSLSERDKDQIKWAVLRAVEKGCLEPALIADRCCFAFERINRYGKNTGFGSCGAISTTAPE